MPLKDAHWVRRCNYKGNPRAVNVQQKRKISFKIKKKDVFKIGYYTYYNLSVRNDIDLESQRAAAVRLAEMFELSEKEKEHIGNTEYPFDFISYDSMKWYDWENDMTKLSEEFPGIEFVLYGEGEERDDTWRAFFKNGECIYQPAHIYYDPEPRFDD